MTKRTPPSPSATTPRKRATRPRVPVALAPIERGVLLTMDEAAAFLGFSRWTVQRWCLDGTLPSVKLGLYRRLPRHALETWIADQERQEAEQARVRRAQSL